MPREARRKSSSKIYHIMIRGINQQNIFVDGEDYETFKAVGIFPNKAIFLRYACLRFIEMDERWQMAGDI